MAITLHREERTSAEHTDLRSVREQILTAAKAAEEAGRHDKIEVVIPGYRHTVTEPLVFSTKENPELSSLDITLRGAYPGAAEINSLVRLNGADFVQAKGKEYFTYQFEKEKGKKYPRFRELFLNFRRIPMTVSPVWRNLDPLTDEERQGNNLREGFWAPIDIAEKVASAPMGATELVMYIEWVYTILHVKKIDLKTTRVENGVTYALVVLKDGEMDFFCRNCSKILNIGNREMFFQNTPAYLEENTFAYDAAKGTLYLDPENKKYMRYHAVEYPALENLLIIDGVDNFTIDGIGFAGATACFPCDHPMYTYQANGVLGLYEEGKAGRFTTAAVLAKSVRGLTVKNCRFAELGGYGVKVADDSYRTTVKDSTFEWISMSAVAIGNAVNAWDDPSNRTYAAHVENNIFKKIGYEYPACPCIYIGQVDGLKILHNTIENCAYSGMSVGWNWDPVSYELGESINIRDAEIAYNYIYNYMDRLRDGGAIYVLGSNCNRLSCDRRFNRMHDNFAAISEAGSFGGKYGYYCDGSASNWEVRDSVIIGCSIPIFSQPHPQALSYHNTFKNIYSTTTIHPSTHIPSRDVITENYIKVEDGLDALLEAYPEAKAIRDKAGSTLIV
ncbi:MAG: right-handed parallel beta-helix repeat-containing protein [Ruminococcaceae bacterium]|nr:right-handed parallel beta-helix repeat-containing protein [Oscillospiraceae bacterium]